MKTAKRFLTAALAVLFTLMCALPVLADETPAAPQTYTLAITNPAAGHTYEVYQIFAGHHTQDGGKEYLSDIVWGSGVKTDNGSLNAMIVELKKASLYDEHTTYVAGVNDATKVAMALSKLKDKAEEVDKFNEIVGAYLDTAIDTKQANGTAPIQFTLPAGYYLVKDKNDSVGENESYTKYLVKLVADATMNIKSQSMSLSKYILNGTDNQKVLANNAAMGDTVHYCLESKLSEMDGYDTYTFIVHDELDAGLTFNNDVAVKIGAGEDNLQDYPSSITVEYAQENGNYSSELPTIEKGQKLYIRITLNNLTQVYKNQLVSITYSATVNEKANIGNTPNTNAAYLEYSNNPNESQQNGQTSTTVTPKTTVSTYVAGIQISKVSPKGSLLPGAQFKIEAQVGTDAINQLNVTGYSFAKAENDSDKSYYYRESDSFVTVAPNGSDQKYVAKGGTNRNTGSSIVGMTGDDEHNTQLSMLRFDGLKAGTYTITEVLAPTGYKKLEKPITVKITWVENSSNHWSYEVTGGTNGDIALGEVKDGVQSFKIVNQHGLTLPFTGGAGANLLAGVGLALMAAAAAAILYIKHRKDRE